LQELTWRTIWKTAEMSAWEATTAAQVATTSMIQNV